MLNNEQIECLKEIKEKPLQSYIDEKFSSLIIRLLISKGFISKSLPYKSNSGNTIYDYELSSKAIEELENNFEF